jgi:CheY-like chemotaxis protein
MISLKEPKAFDVLLVEDSPGDVRLTREAFREADCQVRLHIAVDGVEAMAFLQRKNEYASAPRPDFILLDLNIPRMHGREVLANVKGDVSLKTIPTIILTTSDAESDIAWSYQLQANCYLNKPVLFEEFQGIVNSICDFWLKNVRLPSERDD